MTFSKIAPNIPLWLYLCRYLCEKKRKCPLLPPPPEPSHKHKHSLRFIPQWDVVLPFISVSIAGTFEKKAAKVVVRRRLILGWYSWVLSAVDEIFWFMRYPGKILTGPFEWAFAPREDRMSTLVITWWPSLQNTLYGTEYLLSWKPRKTPRWFKCLWTADYPSYFFALKSATNSFIVWSTWYCSISSPLGSNKTTNGQSTKFNTHNSRVAPTSFSPSVRYLDRPAFHREGQPLRCRP